MENSNEKPSQNTPPSKQDGRTSNVKTIDKNPENKKSAFTTLRPITEKKVDTTLACRYEIKYLIPLSASRAVEKYIADYLPIDHYSKLQPNGFYPIVSLYMDSPDLLLCRESLTGVLNRFKLRIRGYSDDPSYPKFFEIKRRANTVIIKSRARVKTEHVADAVAGRIVPTAKNDPKDNEDLKMYQLYMISIKAKPAVLIRYLRKAYEGTSENRVRVTFDTELCYNVTDEPAVRLSGPGWQRNNVSMKGVIMEIKFTGRFPAWLSRMAELFNIRQRSMSKYATSIENSCLLRFCAPKLPIRA